ncbi:MAG: lipid A deacylase LpxR family protein [Ferruginibacter sp.]
MIFSAFGLLVFMNTNAQRIDYTSTFRQLDAPSYFRFHYDNDYFTKQDQYYTQGITMEYVNPYLHKFPLAILLYKPFATPAQYGLTFNLFGYTPTSILSDSILYGDRPFDANISMQFFSWQTDTVRKRKMSATLSLGVMGKAAQGYEIQYNIHKWLDNPLPHGWQYQIKNDLILNYQLDYEKQLLSAANHFLLNATAEVRLGTLNNKLNTGINFMAGRFNDRYLPLPAAKRKAEYYFYGQGRLNGVVYDASLQGGLLNRKSPYSIASANINRLVFQADAGIIVNFRTIYLSYTQSFITREFTSGSNHRWGGVSVGFAL